MKIMIKYGKSRYFAPHHCPDCGCRLWTTRHPKSKRCRRCHRRHERNDLGKKNRRWRFSHENGYRQVRERIVRRGYCQLCGATENLTCHHVGGEKGRYTCLCVSCHQAYERYAFKKKLKDGLKLKKKRGKIKK